MVIFAADVAEALDTRSSLMMSVVAA